MWGILLLAFLLFTPLSAFANYQLNMPYGVTPISHDIYDLHMTVFYVCCVIAAVVFTLLIYALIKYRRSAGAQAATFHEHLGVEIIWTAIPFIILVCLAIPATRILANIHNTEESAITIQVVGYQWKWKYQYLDSGVKFFSYLSTPLDQIHNRAPKNKWFLLEVDRPLVVPINTKVKLLITSDDVVHSWWVPELGVKQDAVPGFINENWFYITKPGVYRGACGELCGINHGFMPIVVYAVPLTEYNQWITTQQQLAAAKQPIATMTPTDLLTTGKMEYERNCGMCHLNSGLGMTRSYPALKGSVVATGPLDATIGYTLHGVPGTPMQAFDKILDDQAIASIITYVRHAWGNDQLVTRKGYPLIAQPQDVQKIRADLRAASAP